MGGGGTSCLSARDSALDASAASCNGSAMFAMSTVSMHGAALSTAAAARTIWRVVLHSPNPNVEDSRRGIGGARSALVGVVSAEPRLSAASAAVAVAASPGSASTAPASAIRLCRVSCRAVSARFARLARASFSCRLRAADSAACVA